MTSIKHVGYAAEFKALPQEGNDKGRFEAIVSVFGNKDRQNERVIEGAFTKTLQDWQETGHPIPVIFSHDWANPFAHIGRAEPSDVEEVKGRGLKVIGSIDVDTNPLAAQVYHLMKNRQLKEFSFGYEIVRKREAKDGVTDLLELDLIEVGPTLKGANDSTELLAVKSFLEEAAAEEPQAVQTMTATTPNIDYVSTVTVPIVGGTTVINTKAGRSISSKNESKIRSAVESLSEVLASLGDADEKAPTSDTEEAKAEADEPKAIDRDLLALKALIAKG